jgi:hypothetical protein
MNTKLTLVLSLAVCCLGLASAPADQGDRSPMATCTAADLRRLDDPVLQRSFFSCLDSIRHVQYPDNDQDTTLSVDISPAILTNFLKRVDYQALTREGGTEVELQFNIAPAGYTDPPVCTDKVMIRFLPEHCSFRMVIQSHFLVPPDWCHGAQVSYGFRIGAERILNFGRDEAG